MAGFNWFRRAFDKSNKEDAQQEDATKLEQEAKQAAEPSSNDSQQQPGSTAAPQPLSSEDYLKWAKAAYQNIQKQKQAEPESTAQSAAAATAPAAATEQSPSTPEVATEEPPEAVTAADTAVTDAKTPATESETASTAAEGGPEVAPEVVAEPAPSPEPEPVIPAPEPVAEPVSESVESAAESETPTVEAAATPGVEQPVATAPVASTTEPPAVTPEEDKMAAEGGTAAEAEAVTEASTSPEAAAPANVPFWAKAETERQARLERLKETAIVEPAPEPEPQPQPTAAAATPVAEPVLPEVDLDEAFLWSAEVLAAQGRRPDDISVEEITWLNRLRQGLNKTRLGLVNQLKSIVGQGPLNQDAVMEIEALLLQADVGVEATDTIIESLQARLREETLPPEQAIAYLKSLLRDMLDKPLEGSHNLVFVPEKDTLNIWLMTGVNGAGKTTTIGKLAHIAKKSGYSCLIAAADTFRAAAVEQVKAWGARSDVDVIANPGQNTDPAAVVFDAIAAAQSRQTELLLVDTAGRLQNKKNLMDELAKVRRIVDKKAPDARVEALLVLDATLGQNGLRQAEVFAEAANLSGVVLTKLDGTAKGGVALAVVQQLGLPIRFIGAGEGIEDLRPFSSYEFVEALLSG